MLKLPYSPKKGFVKLTQGVGVGSHKTGIDYTGLDFDFSLGSEVLSMADGTIVSIYNLAEDFGEATFFIDRQGNLIQKDGVTDENLGNLGFGNLVTVRHEVSLGDGTFVFYATYAHLSQDSMENIAVGDWVEQGEVLGKLGWTGVLTGDSLHVQVGVDTLVPDNLDPEIYAIADGSPTDLNEILVQTLFFEDVKGKNVYSELVTGRAYLSENGDNNELGPPAFVEDQFPDQASDKVPFSGTEITISFDDVLSTDSPGPGHTIESPYYGLDWGNMAVLKTDERQYQYTGYKNGTISGEWVAFGIERSVTSDGKDFDLVSGYFTAGWNDGLTLEISAYDDGDLVGYDTLVLDTENPTLYYFGEDFLSVDEIVFHSYGGVDNSNGNHELIGPYFVLDDLTVVIYDDAIM